MAIPRHLDEDIMHGQGMKKNWIVKQVSIMLYGAKDKLLKFKKKILSI